MRTVSDWRELQRNWIREYASLARRLGKLLPRHCETLAEIGCGRGQLTIPLARSQPDSQMVVIDSFVGPYVCDRRRLTKELARAKLVGRVQVVVGDALGWLARRRGHEFGAVVSSEFLPELRSKEMASFFRGCYRALRPEGVTVHCFLSPTPRNRSQQLTIEADSDPRWTQNPPREWFSPPPRDSVLGLAKAGFSEAHVETVPGQLRFVGPAARRQLRLWGVRETFAQRYGDELAGEGLELPDWVLLSGRRPS
jgi:cyclopropane fatty-acyl-phospholipid synthase-like methyltransferase